MKGIPGDGTSMKIWFIPESQQFCIWKFILKKYLSLQRFRFKNISVQFSRPLMSDSLWPNGWQQARAPYLLPTREFTQTHVHWVRHAIQPSHPLSSTSPPTFNLSEHQGLFKWVSSLHQVAEVLSRVLLQHFSNHLWDNWELKTLDCRLNYSSEHLGALNNNCLCIS